MRIATSILVAIWDVFTKQPEIKAVLDNTNASDIEELYIKCKNAAKEAFLDSL